MNALISRPGRYIVPVVDNPAPRPHQPQMPAHRILVQAKQHIQPIAMARQRPIRHPHRQKNMAAADDGLVGVVGIEM